MNAATESAAGTAALSYRPARPDEMAACGEIWRDSINAYIGRLGQGEIPPEINPVIRLFVHLQATDPDRFIVAIAPTDGRAADPLSGRGAAVPPALEADAPGRVGHEGADAA